MKKYFIFLEFLFILIPVGGARNWAWKQQAAPDFSIRTIDKFNKVLLEITKHPFFSIYDFRQQKRYLCRHLVKSTSMKLSNFICRLQELNACLAEFPSDTEGQEIESLPADEIMDIIYHCMPTMWKNKMIKEVSIMKILPSKKKKG